MTVNITATIIEEACGIWLFTWLQKINDVQGLVLMVALFILYPPCIDLKRAASPRHTLFLVTSTSPIDRSHSATAGFFFFFQRLTGAAYPVLFSLSLSLSLSGCSFLSYSQHDPHEGES